MAAAPGDQREDNDVAKESHQGWLTVLLAVSGLLLAAAPVTFALNIYDYFTREYVPSFGTPIGLPLEFWLAQLVGVTGAALLIAAVARARGTWRLGQRRGAENPAKAISWGRAGVMSAATLGVGLLSLFAPFVGGDPSFVEGPLNDYARHLGLYLIGLTLLADLLLMGWVVVCAGRRVPPEPAGD